MTAPCARIAHTAGSSRGGAFIRIVRLDVENRLACRAIDRREAASRQPTPSAFQLEHADNQTVVVVGAYWQATPSQLARLQEWAVRPRAALQSAARPSQLRASLGR